MLTRCSSYPLTARIKKWVLLALLVSAAFGQSVPSPATSQKPLRERLLERALQGDPFAEASLGIFYGAGKGIKQDYVLAYAWLNRSATHLTGPDRESVLDLRDSIGQRMTAAQLARAGNVLPAEKSATQQ